MLKKNERPTLLRYWTTRYFLTLCIGLLIVGVISTVWIRHSNTERRLEILEMTAEEIAERIAYTSEFVPLGLYLPKILEDRFRFLRLEGKPLIYVTDQYGRNILYGLKDQIYSSIDFNKLISYSNIKNVQKISLPHGEDFYLVKKEIVKNNRHIGWVFILLQENELKRSPDEIKLLVIMLSSLAALGWAVIYFLSKKLSRPITDMATAANRIVEGDYRITVDETIKEKEIYELLYSFREMASRLEQLESLRTELLAGVTHELKTPVTAISGLIQAVKDEVVTGDEAKYFLTLSQKEVSRLQKMVEDLLDFNSFATGKVRIAKEMINLRKYLEEILYQWELLHEYSPKMKFSLSEQELWISTDPLRLRQIIVNLLNNAKQACQDDCEITLNIYGRDNSVYIDVIDNGSGIPKEEQLLIFERFFRGSNKKHKIRGLGLGLPFSKMIAKALGGDLFLKESSERGTIFTIQLPRQR
ncbi:ATP-binding protein [Calidifontibacillus erzurumensis]|uniref:histidine kinase n=1 Tax=Calidifontibacillus erzurumensis TaxID=2741433 RepID=A0A8J8K8X5_9BACI|nr:ATP-binding protein [Calidifontibacillus erzurumensis]NSL52446.1 HAMP domain-containing histidine kinase [Calidifontibacillus erzurumensis]